MVCEVRDNELFGVIAGLCMALLGFIILLIAAQTLYKSGIYGRHVGFEFLEGILYLIFGGSLTYLRWNNIKTSATETEIEVVQSKVQKNPSNSLPNRDSSNLEPFGKKCNFMEEPCQ